MKLFSFKSLCLRWRGELIDNANVPVGPGERKGKGGETVGGVGWDGGGRVTGGRQNLVQVFNSHFKYHMKGD